MDYTYPNACSSDFPTYCEGAPPMECAKVGKRGTVVIPAEMRRHHRLEEGTPVIIEDRPGDPSYPARPADGGGAQIRSAQRMLRVRAVGLGGRAPLGVYHQGRHGGIHRAWSTRLGLSNRDKAQLNAQQRPRLCKPGTLSYGLRTATPRASSPDGAPPNIRVVAEGDTIVWRFVPSMGDVQRAAASQ